VPFAVRRRRLLGGALAALAAGCAPVSLINRLTPTDTYRREPGLAYGPHARQRLDAYLPAAGASRAPVVLFFYGGAWRSGDRADYLFVGEALASRGIVALVADYRLYPEVRFPAFVADAALAAAWAVTHAAQFGADPGRLFVMGHSAGAYNAAMIALDRSYLAAADADPAAIRGLIGLAGPYDFLPLSSPPAARDLRLPRDLAGHPADPLRAARRPAGAPADRSARPRRRSRQQRAPGGAAARRGRRGADGHLRPLGPPDLDRRPGGAAP